MIHPTRERNLCIDYLIYLAQVVYRCATRVELLHGCLDYGWSDGRETTMWTEYFWHMVHRWFDNVASTFYLTHFCPTTPPFQHLVRVSWNLLAIIKGKILSSDANVVASYFRRRFMSLSYSSTKIHICRNVLLCAWSTHASSQLWHHHSIPLET
jgi:hypothetical protein